MRLRIEERGGHRLLILDDEGPALTRAQDAIDLIAEALPQRAQTIIVPVARLDPSFFRLRSGLAGEVAQKIVNYRLKLAVIGDVSEFIRESQAFADFVRESNQGRNLLFLQDVDAVVQKLSALEDGTAP